jgi:hypothetical protein
MSEYWDVIKHAFYFLLRAYLVFGVFWLSKYLTAKSKSKLLRLYLSTVAIVGFLAWLSGDSLGTHTENADPVFGGGDEVTDFEATDSQRIKHGVSTFIIVLTPALIGVWHGLKDRNTKPSS